ncbi:hypothetical protein TNCV_2006951 [Trichonephila clavipes]|nr:hypothetical protein TNCV_2006951 [Trichonephila clavipes]
MLFLKATIIAEAPSSVAQQLNAINSSKIWAAFRVPIDWALKIFSGVIFICSDNVACPFDSSSGQGNGLVADMS